MKIIQLGVIKKKTRVFTCPECGCIFEADETEYKVTDPINTLHYGLGDYNCECPCCHKITYQFFDYISRRKIR